MLDGFLRLLLIPLQWLPAGILVFLNVIISFFGIFIFGRLLKWVWDALPLA